MTGLALQISKLVKVYGKSFKALHEIDLNIKQGDFFALLGPNGAGKSTIINVISSTIRKTAGTVKIMGFDLDTQTKLAKRKIGVVPQEVVVDPFFTALDTLMLTQGYYGLKPSKKRAMEILELLHLDSKASANTRQLSGGMKRRLLVAKALVHDPDIVILDEPTAGVDVELRHEMWQQFINLNKAGKTIILTTHNLEEVEHMCKNVAIVNKGKIIVNDSKDNLMKRFSKQKLIIEGNLPTIPATIQDKVIEQETNKVVFEFFDPQDTGYILEQLMQKSGTKIASINTQQENFEDVFLSVTNN